MIQHDIKPIIITPEQIIAAAQKIANEDDDAHSYTADQYVVAVRRYLESCVNDLLVDADWHANRDNFSATTIYDNWLVDEAEELAIPVPEWATQPALQGEELPF
jgi:hypothetical protein